MLISSKHSYKVNESIKINQSFSTRFGIKILKIKLGRRTLYDGNHGVDCGLALVG